MHMNYNGYKMHLWIFLVSDPDFAGMDFAGGGIAVLLEVWPGGSFFAIGGGSMLASLSGTSFASFPVFAGSLRIRNTENQQSNK